MGYFIIHFGNFMYFPDDKSEYIPAVLQLIAFMLLAFLVFRVITIVSKRELQKAKEVEERMKQYESQQKNMSSDEQK